MLPIKTVLYPTDFSDCAEYAFQLACSLAGDYGARLVVAHVCVPPMAAFEVGPVPVIPVEDRPALEARLEQLRRFDDSVPVECLLREGDPPTEILRLAREESCDLIVMGTHGRSGFRRLLMGSVAEEVLRKAPCPVVTVKHPPAEPVGQ